MVATALNKAVSERAVHPTPPGKDIQEIDLHELTRSNRKFVVAQALEVPRPDSLSSSSETNLLVATVGDNTISALVSG